MDALFKLRPCSGSTVCHYLTFMHRASFSVLAKKNLLPETVRHIYIYDNSCHSLLLKRHSHSQTRPNPLAPTNLLSEDLGRLKHSIKEELRAEDAEVLKIASYYFEQSGKMIRPSVIMLMSHACNQQPSTLSRGQFKIALVAEMIHTASLLHDDVVDEATLRRNVPSVNILFGNKKTILAGDYILAKATKVLASIGEPFVIKLLAQVIEDLVKGEFMQMSVPVCDQEKPLEVYLRKTFLKTASLFANSCKAVAFLAQCSERVQDLAYAYGKHIGLAFQIIDDALDFAGDANEMGKDVAADLKLGISTAPVLFAAERDENLKILMRRRFSQDGDVRLALDLVHKHDGVQKSKALAQAQVDRALTVLDSIQPSAYRDELSRVAHTFVTRTR